MNNIIRRAGEKGKGNIQVENERECGDLKSYHNQDSHVDDRSDVLIPTYNYGRRTSTHHKLATQRSAPSIQ